MSNRSLVNVLLPRRNSLGITLDKAPRKAGKSVTRPEPAGQWLTVPEAADLLRVRKRTLYHWVARGRVPYTKAGGKLLFTREQLLAWLAAQSQAVPEATRGLFDPPAVIAGSHDPLLEWAVQASRCGLGIEARGSSDGLDRLARGLACAALIHVPDSAGDGFNRQALTNRTAGLPIAAIRWARREQGLLVARGNPHRLSALADLTRRPVRTAMRQAGAGSNLLFGKLLQSNGLTLSRLLVVEPRAQSENELAQAVHDGLADVGFGIRAAAAHAGTDFVPLVWEDVDLAFWQQSYFQPPLQALLGALRTPAFARQAKRLGGYAVSDNGQISYY